MKRKSRYLLKAQREDGGVNLHEESIEAVSEL
jgi:hypothetical protein